MKIKQLFLLASLLLSSLFMNAQCTSCTDSGNTITYLGNNKFKAATAQAYFWKICSGSASIVGSNTSQTVTVSSNGSYKIKVTRFVNGQCYVSCEAKGGSSSCPPKIIYINEGGGGICTTGQASVGRLFNVDYVDWSWRLGGSSGTINNAGTTTPIYYPSRDWTNHYIVVSAKVVFKDGKVCNISNRFLLNCGSGPGSPVGNSLFKKSKQELSLIYPNPSKDSKFAIKKNKNVEISEININDSNGVSVKSIKNDFNNEIDLSIQKEGLYFVEIKYTNGSFEVKKLVLKK